MREALREYHTLLQARRAPCLDYLNARVPHRYTAIYRLADGHLHNVDLYDKQGEMRPDFLAVVPLEDSFCQFVLRNGSLLCDDSRHEPLLDGHKYQGAMLAYHGVPLLDDHGELFGTLCHFDTVSHGLSDEELQILHGAARILPAYL